VGVAHWLGAPSLHRSQGEPNEEDETVKRFLRKFRPWGCNCGLPMHCGFCGCCKGD